MARALGAEGIKGNPKRGRANSTVLYVLLALVTLLFLVSSTGYMVPFVGGPAGPSAQSSGGYGRMRMLREEAPAAAATPIHLRSFDEKWRLLDSVLGLEVFEMNVTRLPPLLPLFREYEKARQWFAPDMNFSDYDRSCDKYYQDSLSNAGDFDREHYSEKEYLYKVGIPTHSRAPRTTSPCQSAML